MSAIGIDAPRHRRAALLGRRRAPRDAARRLRALPAPARARHARRRLGAARGLRRADARGRRRPRPVRLPGARPARARRRRALRRRRRRGRRRADARRRRAPPPRLSRSTTKSCRRSSTPSRRSRPAPCCCIRRRPTSADEAVSIGVRPLPGHERLPSLPARQRRRRRGLRGGRRDRRGGVPHAERGARPDGAARRARGVGGRPAHGLGRHADAVQHARRPRRPVRPRRRRRPDRRAADGRLVRGQDVRAHGGARRRARAQGASGR